MKQTSPLITGSARVPSTLERVLAKKLTELFKSFSEEHKLTEDFFFQVISSGSLVLDSESTAPSVEPTEEERMALTAGRSRVVPPSPHPAFGIKLPD